MKYGSEFLVTATTSVDEPTVTALANGRFVVAWTDDRDIDPRYPQDNPWRTEIFSQVFNSDGSRHGNDFKINTTTWLHQNEPNIAALADGRFVASWTDFSLQGDRDSAGIRGQILNSDGSLSGIEFLVNTRTSNQQISPVVSSLSSGQFVIAWVDNGRSNGPAIAAQIFNSNGTRSGGEILVDEVFAGESNSPQITGLSNGNFVVSWQSSNSSGGDTSPSVIRARIIAADGSRLGSELQINSTTAYEQMEPSVTALANGRFVVVWTDNSRAYDVAYVGADVRAQVFEADGSALGREMLIGKTTLGEQNQPDIASLDDGRFVVVWADQFNDLSGLQPHHYYDIFAQVYNIDGSTSGAQFLVNTTQSGFQTFPEVSVLADGRFVVVWHDASPPNTTHPVNAVRGQIFDPRLAAVNLTGTSEGDDFRGTRYDDTIVGNDGDDRIFGRSGADVLSGGLGNDLIRGEAGNDKLTGGLGDDLIYGDNDIDYLYGGVGNDTLDGGAGNDILFGQVGNDVLKAGTGSDRLIGGANRDLLYGGTDTSPDVFDFNLLNESVVGSKRDVIYNFTRAADDIDLSTIDARAPTAANEVFLFKGTAATAYSVWYSVSGSNVIVKGDVTGDKIADFEILVVGVTSLSSGDFIL